VRQLVDIFTGVRQAVKFIYRSEIASESLYRSKTVKVSLHIGKKAGILIQE
jgi:hypothetical protein